jgi:hypothetical protein
MDMWMQTSVLLRAAAAAAAAATAAAAAAELKRFEQKLNFFQFPETSTTLGNNCCRV